MNTISATDGVGDAVPGELAGRQGAVVAVHPLGDRQQLGPASRLQLQLVLEGLQVGLLGDQRDDPVGEPIEAGLGRSEHRRRDAPLEAVRQGRLDERRPVAEVVLHRPVADPGLGRHAAVRQTPQPLRRPCLTKARRRRRLAHQHGRRDRGTHEGMLLRHRIAVEALERMAGPCRRRR